MFLPVLDKSDARFLTCARSAASVCNAYKRLSQNKTLTYTMISLHSCFVAGLTLVYCIWRDPTLFSCEVLEATQSCSQILTIFGEKWPGAAKYRDIFDSLSRSLFRLTVGTADSKMHPDSTSPLQLSLERQPLTTAQLPCTRPNSHTLMSYRPLQAAKSTMSHLVTDAVKEAFMEVDEEAPGGWQGWRMWNEMITDSSGGKPHSVSRLDDCGHGPPVTNWNSCADSGYYGIDPIQDEALCMSNYSTMGHDPWGLAGFR